MTSKRLISACLVGINCRYDGGNAKCDLNPKEFEDYRRGEFIPVCPEQLGGFCTPREAAEIIDGDGEDVLQGRARVVTISGIDVTEKLVKGAYEALKIAEDLGIQEAILKQYSPSCGCGLIHDGTFSKGLRVGNGVTSALLDAKGIRIIPDDIIKLIG